MSSSAPARTSTSSKGPLKAGDVVRMASFVHYDLDESDRFSRIRIASYRDPE